MSEPDDDSNLSGSEIAIVGMACRFPGAGSVQEYWQNLLDGVESITRLTDDELLAAGESPSRMRQPNYVPASGVMDRMEMFDGEFFGFSPKESAIVDPQHRHFLELSWAAMEDAGHTPERFEGPVGVYAGCGMGSYFYFNVCSNPDLVDDVGMFLLRHTGNDKDFLATRVSYAFNLTGPSVNVQTACSTSLVAVHLACQSLLNNEVDMALAGGSTIEIPHRRGYLYHEGEVLSPDGHCHAFDHRGQGTVFGSGAGVVALRRLEDALEDGDHIYAVIRGTAINNDGARKVGYLAPSVDGQAACMVEAHQIADVEPDSIGYVECHGTGTYMGDPIEVAALTAAFREGTEANQYCRIGSVKTNIGHLDTAAGVASLIKAALIVKHGQIPASLNFEKPNPTIDFESSPFLVNDGLTAWPQELSPRRAAVNSLGVGGTNAHIVLQEPPPREASKGQPREIEILPLSARNRTSLDGACDELADFLEHNEVALGDVARTLTRGRKLFERRRVLAVRSREEAVELLRSKDARRVFTHTAVEESPSVVFMMPGGGAQYVAMGRGLYESEPLYREWIDKGLAWLKKETGEDYGRFFFPADGVDLGALSEEQALMRYQLPCTFVTSFALAKLWMARGLKPAAMIGHSMGENTAAALAGVMTFEECLALVTLRGQLMDESEPGAMLSIPLTRPQVEELAGDELELSIVNGPELCCLSGPVPAIEALEKKLTDMDVDVQRLRITIAAHSRLMDSLLPKFKAFLETLTLRSPTIPIVSNLTGTWLTGAQATDPEYWTRHLRSTVQFADGVGTLLETPGRILLESGPGRTLTSLARQHPAATPNLNCIGSLRHRDEETDDAVYFQTMLGRVWASGGSVELPAAAEGAYGQHIPLPTYSFAHQHYFIEPGKREAAPEVEQQRIERVDDWGFSPVWTRAFPDPGDEHPHTWLFFMDDAGIAEQLAKELASSGHKVLRVHAGDAFAKNSNTEYVVSPERGGEGFEELMRELVQDGHTPDRIVHAWLLTSDESFRPGSSFFHRNLENGFYSLFFLGKALLDDSVPRPLHITVLTNGMQQVADEALPYPEKATVLGPARVIPRELPGVTCRVIDVALPRGRDQLFGGRLRMALADPFAGRREVAEERARLVEALCDDLLAAPDNAVVALRQERRFEQRYRKAPLPALEAPPVKDGTTVLITGGLGGLGLVAARHLARTAKVNLVLVGRSGLPAREAWAEWLRTHSPEEATSRRIRAVENLENDGATVLVARGDVTNVKQMRDILDEARKRFGSLDGVLHTAGAVDDGLLAMKTQESVEKVFSPKIHGTQILAELVENDDLQFFVLYSSTSAVTAPAGQVDYVAANAFLNAHATRARQRGRRETALCWGIWNEVGMAAEALGAQHASSPPQPTVYPLFGNAKKDKRGRRVFELPLDTSLWLLDEHRTLAGHALIPGTGYIELIDAALREMKEARPYEIRDLYFIRPLYVADDATLDAMVRLSENDRGYSVEIRSACEVEGKRATQLHAMAQVHMARGAAPSAESPDAIIARCGRKQSDPKGIRSPQERHLRFGPRWRVLQEAHFGEGEAIGKVVLPPTFADDANHFDLHPALLDYATGFAMDLIEGYEPSKLWVPMSYDRIRIYGRLPIAAYAWVRLAEGSEKSGVASFDVDLLGESGEVAMHIEGFSIKRLDGEVDFAVASKPSLGDVERENDTEPLSPAERQLQRNLEMGILPKEGGDALLRVIGHQDRPVRVVSSLDLDDLLAQAEASMPAESDGGTKFSRPDLDSEYVEPRDDVERTLVGLWESLLGVDQVGVKDNFFELGGHSLIAVRLFSKIKKIYQADFSIAVLLEAPTIEACASLIKAEIGEEDHVAAEAEPRTRYTHLVPMHPGEGGERTPFFLVAGMFGNVLNLRHLAHLLGGDRKFYGVQAAGLFGDQKPHETFEEMAAAYIEEIRQVQPHGPYLLGGFSGGGITALELAQTLKAQGEEVALVVMLDTPFPTRLQLTPADRVKIQVQRLKERGPAYVGEWAKNRWNWEVGKLRARFEEPELRKEHEFHNEAIEAAFYRALERYQPRYYHGRIAMFRPKLDEHYVLGEGRVLSKDGEWQRHDNGWGPHCEAIDVCEVPGNHDSMVLEPNVRVLADLMREAIEQVDRDSLKAAQ